MFPVSGDDMLQRKTQGYVVPDSFTHATSEQRQSLVQCRLPIGQSGELQYLCCSAAVSSACHSFKVGKARARQLGMALTRFCPRRPRTNDLECANPTLNAKIQKMVILPWVCSSPLALLSKNLAGYR
jgi:hypothetical protein